MKGLLADINIQGCLPALQAAMQDQELAEIIAELKLSFHVLRDFGLPSDLDDRQLWTFCQTYGLVLLTDNRNEDGADSLAATLKDSLHADSLPVLTPGSKGRLQHDRTYQSRVAKSIVEILFGIAIEAKYLGGRTHVLAVTGIDLTLLTLAERLCVSLCGSYLNGKRIPSPALLPR